MVGCSSDPEVRDDEQAQMEAEAAARAEAERLARERQQAMSDAATVGSAAYAKKIEAMLSDPSSPLSNHVFYFPYDSAEVSSGDREIIGAHAEFLASHPEIMVTVEGHADERGTREYNLALGERRAMAVEMLLKVQGAADKQLQMVSFGEERPVALGNDEQAWSLNRRVELIYSGY
ncbi:MAG: peptidoglycan-associated lipoprotein Pal [Gammaproteobacteria bacterium]|nr:peptidoglycan-associated lipoprotein Pal [Gammaproteobacteria bacterium]